MYKDLIQIIHEEKEKAGYQPEYGCSEGRMLEFRELFHSIFQYSLPQEMAHFLRYANGFEWDGTVFLGVDQDNDDDLNDTFSHSGILSHNTVSKQQMLSQYPILIGWNSIEQFYYDPKRNSYYIMDSMTKQQTSIYSSFDKLLADQLQLLIEPDLENSE